MKKHLHGAILILLASIISQESYASLNQKGLIQEQGNQDNKEDDLDPVNQSFIDLVAESKKNLRKAEKQAKEIAQQSEQSEVHEQMQEYKYPIEEKKAEPPKKQGFFDRAKGFVFDNLDKLKKVVKEYSSKIVGAAGKFLKDKFFSKKADKQKIYKSGISPKKRALLEDFLANEAATLEFLYRIILEFNPLVIEDALNAFLTTFKGVQMVANRIYVNPNDIINNEQYLWLYNEALSHQRHRQRAINKYTDQENEADKDFRKQKKQEAEEEDAQLFNYNGERAFVTFSGKDLPILKNQNFLNQKKEAIIDLAEGNILGTDFLKKFAQNIKKEDEKNQQLKDFVESSQDIKKEDEQDPKWKGFIGSLDENERQRIMEMENLLGDIQKKKADFNTLDRAQDHIGIYSPYYQGAQDQDVDPSNEIEEEKIKALRGEKLAAHLKIKYDQDLLSDNMKWLQERAQQKGYKGKIYGSAKRNEDFDNEVKNKLEYSQLKGFPPSEIVAKERQRMNDLQLSKNDKQMMKDLYSAYILLTTDTDGERLDGVWQDSENDDLLRGPRFTFHKNYENRRMQKRPGYAQKKEGMESVSGSSIIDRQRHAFFFRIIFPHWVELLKNQYGYDPKNVILIDEGAKHSISLEEAKQLEEQLDAHYGNQDTPKFFTFYNGLNEDDKNTVRGFAMQLLNDEEILSLEKYALREFLFNYTTYLEDIDSKRCHEVSALCAYKLYKAMVKKHDLSAFGNKPVFPYMELGEFLESIEREDNQRSTYRNQIIQNLRNAGYTDQEIQDSQIAIEEEVNEKILAWKNNNFQDSDID